MRCAKLVSENTIIFTWLHYVWIQKASRTSRMPLDCLCSHLLPQKQFVRLTIKRLRERSGVAHERQNKRWATSRTGKNMEREQVMCT